MSLSSLLLRTGVSAAPAIEKPVVDEPAVATSHPAAAPVPRPGEEEGSARRRPVHSRSGPESFLTVLDEMQLAARWQICSGARLPPPLPQLLPRPPPRQPRPRPPPSWLPPRAL